MTALLDGDRISYAARKVRRFREDVEEWERTPRPTDGGALEDVIRDTNRIAQDYLALDRWALGLCAVNPAGAGYEPLRLVGKLLAEWSQVAARVLRVAEAGGASERVADGVNELRAHLETVRTLGAADPVARVFRELVRVWRAETAYISSTSELVGHPAFQRIVALGDPAVPLLLAEIRSRPSHLMAALKRITGADPVAPESRGRMGEMADAWVKWGEARQLI